MIFRVFPRLHPTFFPSERIACCNHLTVSEVWRCKDQALDLLLRHATWQLALAQPGQAPARTNCGVPARPVSYTRVVQGQHPDVRPATRGRQGRPPAAPLQAKFSLYPVRGHAGGEGGECRRWDAGAAGQGEAGRMSGRGAACRATAGGQLSLFDERGLIGTGCATAFAAPAAPPLRGILSDAVLTSLLPQARMSDAEALCVEELSRGLGPLTHL